MNGDVPKVLSVSSLESLRERLADYERAVHSDEAFALRIRARDYDTALEASERDAARLREALEEARIFVEKFYDYQHPGERGQTLALVDAALRRGDPNGL